MRSLYEQNPGHEKRERIAGRRIALPTGIRKEHKEVKWYACGTKREEGTDKGDTKRESIDI